jgi:peptide/nickel transport system substrate-binding protein
MSATFPRSSAFVASPVLGLLLLAGSGCRLVPADASTLTVAIDSGPVSLDPRLGSDEASRRFNDLVFSALFRVGDDGRPQPELAERFEIPDPLTVIVTLRAGVRFHDGAPLHPEDVVDTYRSILEDRVTSFRKADLESVASVSAEGDHTVVFRLRRPFAPILTNLNIPILRAGAGPDAARHPNGTGPFRLERYRKDEDLDLARFDAYYEGRSPVARIRLRIIPSETARLLELLKGTVDLVVNDLSPDQLARVRGRSGFHTERRSGRNVVYMAFNLSDPILADRRVRQAIAWSLDRQEIVTHLLHGAAVLATGLLPPGHWAYNPSVATYQEDAARAATLLDEAGFPDPDGPGPKLRFRLEYKAPASELAQQLASVLQGQLRRIGIGVDVRTFEWATFYDDLRAGRFQMVVSNWTEISDPDIYRLRFHSARRPPNGLNRGGYSREEVDHLIDEGAVEVDPEKRRQAYARLQAILAEDLPYVCLWHREVTVALRDRVRGFRLGSGADFRPLWRVGLADATVEPSDRDAGSVQDATEHRLDGGARDGTGADQAGRIDREVDDRRGAAAGGRSAIEDEGHEFPERFLGLASGRGGRPSGAIGAGRDDGTSRGPRQPGRHRVGGDAHADRAPAAEEKLREILRRRQHDRQGARPEGVHEAMRRLRHGAGARLDRVALRGDQGQRHPVGPAFRGKDPLHRLRLPGIARQAVERLGGIDDEKASPQRLAGTGEDVRLRPLRVHPLDSRCHRPLAFRRGGQAITIAQVEA